MTLPSWRRARRPGGRGATAPAPALGLALAIALGAALAPLAPPAAAAGPSPYRRTLYQWSSEDGVVRYTALPERVPRSRRHTMVEVVPGRSAIENARRLSGEPDDLLVEEPIATERRPAPVPVERIRTIDARIRELEIAIARDQEALKSLISHPEGAGRLRESPELARIGERLPELQAELRALRRQRDRLSGAVAP